MSLFKHSGQLLGGGLGNNGQGAVVLSVAPKGLFADWNRGNPDHTVEPGFTITEVNGATGFWSILEAIRTPGELTMKVTCMPPPRAGPNWFDDVAEMGKKLQKSCGKKNSVLLRLGCTDSTDNSTDKSTALSNWSSNLPTMRANECGTDQCCAICMEDVSPHESLVQLPCKHAFHELCVARWLTQVDEGCNSRQCCPLCNRKIVSTKDGKLMAQEPSMPSVLSAQ
jgi:hypothetical protein